MLEIAMCQQRVCGCQVLQDRAFTRIELGIDDAAQPAEPCPVGAILAVGFNGEDRLDADRLAQRKVVLAVVRGHVDEAGAGLGGDEGRAVEEGARLGEEAAELVHRVAGDGSGEVGAFDRRLLDFNPNGRQVLVESGLQDTVLELSDQLGLFGNR